MVQEYQDTEINRRNFLKVLTAGTWLAVIHGLALSAAHSPGINRPNIVWIMAEDISTELECHGHPAVKTPNLNRLAGGGVPIQRQKVEV